MHIHFQIVKLCGKCWKENELYSLKQVGEWVLDAKSEGELFTHATYSTTRKVEGTFAFSEIDINWNEYLPLPTLSVSSDTRNNTADFIATDFRLLEAASVISAEEIYSKIDVQMTDSTSHNKGTAKKLAETFHRKEIAGQIFRNSDITLGFDKEIAKTIHTIENKMEMESIFSGFLLDIDIDQSLISIPTVSWCLSLFGRENINKVWNYYKNFYTFLQRKGCIVHLFLEQ